MVCIYAVLIVCYFLNAYQLVDNNTYGIAIWGGLVGLAAIAAVYFSKRFIVLIRKGIKDFGETIELLMGNWIFFSFINLGMYVVDRDNFRIAGSGTWIEDAFEFIYYVFCNSLTYGSCRIEPVSILAKIIQMTNTIMVSVIMINWLTGLLSERVKKH